MGDSEYSEKSGNLGDSGDSEDSEWEESLYVSKFENLFDPGRFGSLGDPGVSENAEIQEIRKFGESGDWGKTFCVRNKMNLLEPPRRIRPEE